jgi:hypothetical protein
MSINLGAAGISAIRFLRMSEHWPEFAQAFADVASAKAYAALESPPEARVDATAYARALVDIHVAITAAVQDINARAVPKLPITKRGSPMETTLAS